MTAPVKIERSILPVDRGHTWNTLQDLMADAYRQIGEDEQVVGMLVRVKGRDGRGALIIRGRRGVRRVALDEQGRRVDDGAGAA